MTCVSLLARSSQLLILLMALISVIPSPAQCARQAGGLVPTSSSTSTLVPLCIWREFCPRIDGSSINLARCNRPPAPAPDAAAAHPSSGSGQSMSASSSSSSSSQVPCAAPDSWRIAHAAFLARQRPISVQSPSRRGVASFKSIHAQRLGLTALPLGLCGLEAIADELFLSENQLRAFPDTNFTAYSGLSAVSSSSALQSSDLVAREQRDCLRRLDPVVLKLYDNQLVAIDLDFIISLPRLEELDLSRNLLETLPPVHATLELIERSVLKRVILKENRLKVVDTSLLQFIALEFVDLSQNRIANVSNLIPWALDRSAIELRRYDRYIQHSFGQNSGQAASIVGTQSQTGSGTGLGQSGPGAAPGQLASAATSATYTEKVAVQVYRNDFTGSFGRAKWFLVPELTKIPDLKETILAVSRFIKQYQQLVTVDIRESRVTCDCSMLETLKYLKKVMGEAAEGRPGPPEQVLLKRFLEEIRCNEASGVQLNERAFASLEEAELKCPLVDRCPASCTCTHTPAIFEVRLDCALMPGSLPTALNNMRANGAGSGSASPSAFGMLSQQGLPAEIALPNHQIVLNLTAAESLVPASPNADSSGAVVAVLAQTKVFDARRARLTRLAETLSVVTAARRTKNSRLSTVQLAGNPFRCVCSRSELAALRELQMSAGVNDHAAIECIFPDRPDVRVNVLLDLETTCSRITTSMATTTTATTTLTTRPSTLPPVTTASSTTGTSSSTTPMVRVVPVVFMTNAPTEAETETVSVGGGGGVLVVAVIACALLLVLIFLVITMCIIYYMYQRDKLRQRKRRKRDDRLNLNRIYNPLGTAAPNFVPVVAVPPLSCNSCHRSSLSLPGDNRTSTNSRRQSAGFRERPSRQERRSSGTYQHHSRPGSREDSPDGHSPDRLTRGLFEPLPTRDREPQGHYANEHNYANANAIQMLSSPDQPLPRANNNNMNNVSNSNNNNNIRANGNGVVPQHRPSAGSRSHSHDEGVGIGGLTSEGSTPSSSFAGSMSPTTGHDSVTAPLRFLNNVLPRALTHHHEPRAHSHSHQSRQRPPASVNANDEFVLMPGSSPSTSTTAPATTTATTTTTMSFTALNNAEPDSDQEPEPSTQLAHSPPTRRPLQLQPSLTPAPSCAATVSAGVFNNNRSPTAAAALQSQSQLPSPSAESTRSHPLSTPQPQQHRRRPTHSTQLQSQNWDQNQNQNQSPCSRASQPTPQSHQHRQPALNSSRTPQMGRARVSAEERARRTRSRGDLLPEHDRSSGSTHSTTRQPREEISFV